MRVNSLNLLRSIPSYIRSRPIARVPQYGLRCYSSEDRKWSTPLAKTLSEAIITTGPVSVAAYMRQCLTSDLGGYYTRTLKDRDQFGAKGDFITSPEISQIFGELVGIWIVAEWMAQGKKSSGVQILEVGPGRGTLVDDALRTIRNFKPLADSIESIYMIEASPSLRDAQKKLLCGEDAPMEEIDIGYQSTSKYNKNLKITWCEDIRLIPQGVDKSPFIIAHEFFDALPIHVFQSIEASKAPDQIVTPTGPITPTARQKANTNNWRELVVSPVPDHQMDAKPSKLSAEAKPEFQLTMAKQPTPHSQYLPLTSPRYKALSGTPGSIIEVSPESLSYISDIAVRIGGSNHPSPGSPSSSSALEPLEKPQPSGAALILDYGPKDTIPANTLRGIKAHKPVSPLSEPGVVDISADVDFLGLAEAAINSSPGVEVHGPVEQGVWLSAMGIRERAEMLLKGAKGNEELVDRVLSGWKRLVDMGPTGMGRIYKVMAVVPHVPGVRRQPVGFGGDVSL